jgi:hypothetical protein
VPNWNCSGEPSSPITSSSCSEEWNTSWT